MDHGVSGRVGACALPRVVLRHALGHVFVICQLQETMGRTVKVQTLRPKTVILALVLEPVSEIYV